MVYHLCSTAPVLLVLTALLLACSGESTSSASTNTSASPDAQASSDTPTIPSATPRPAEPGANAHVQHVRAVQSADGTWTFHVTVQHPDTGWEDYTNGWDVVTPDGKVLKPDPDSQFTRVLLHPHVDEQPFTRSQSGIAIPDGITKVHVRAHDLVDGFGGREVVVDLMTASGPDFEVKRQQ